MYRYGQATDTADIVQLNCSVNNQQCNHSSNVAVVCSKLSPCVCWLYHYV